MPEIRGFQGWRYNSLKVRDFADVLAPPYDVISKNEQKNLYKKSPFNVARLILGEEGEEEPVVLVQEQRAEEPEEEPEVIEGEEKTEGEAEGEKAEDSKEAGEKPEEAKKAEKVEDKGQKEEK